MQCNPNGRRANGPRRDLRPTHSSNESICQLGFKTPLAHQFADASWISRPALASLSSSRVGGFSAPSSFGIRSSRTVDNFIKVKSVTIQTINRVPAFGISSTSSSDVQPPMLLPLSCHRRSQIPNAIHFAFVVPVSVQWVAAIASLYPELHPTCGSLKRQVGIDPERELDRADMDGTWMGRNARRHDDQPTERPADLVRTDISASANSTKHHPPAVGAYGGVTPTRRGNARRRR